MNETIPDKLFFKIGEVGRILGVKPYVLRFWETEFASFVKPSKSKTGQRQYERKDIETLLLIKKLVHEERFTLEGAKEQLKALRKAPDEREALLGLKRAEALVELVSIGDELRDLADKLDN